MKFELDRHNLIHVPVKVIHHQEVVITALVDTGSAGTVFEIGLFDIDLFEPNSEVVEIVGVGGTQEVLIQTVEAILIGNAKITSFRAQFGDLAGQFGFGGILGGDILKTLGAIINYPTGAVEFGQSR